MTRDQIDILRRAIRTLDCGWHYCRYCTAGSRNGWQHHDTCAYQQSVRDAEAANFLLATLNEENV